MNVTTLVERSAQGRDGTRLAYRVAGSGDVPLVFLHGWAGSGTGRFWDTTLGHLDLDGVRVLAVDLRGHGKSEAGFGPCTIDDLAADALAILDAERLSTGVLVGHSVGGRVAMRLASRHGSRVRGQVLVAPVPPIAVPFTDDLLGTWFAARRSRESWGALLAQFTKDPLGPDVIADFFEDASHADEQGLRNLFNICRVDPFVDSLGQVTCPTLIVSGRHDAGFPPALLRQTIQERVAGARLVSTDAGHEIPLETPDLTAALIDAFVAGRPDGAVVAAAG